MHVAIAGGGIFGQVIAWRLAARGAKVTVIEPVGPGNASSASGDRSRVVRALYDVRSFAEAGALGLAMWSRWSSELGARLIEPTGVLYIEREEGTPGAAAFRAWLDAGVANVRALGGEAVEMDGAEANRRWPGLSPAGIRRAVFEPAGGFGRPALAARSIALAGLQTGLITHIAGAASLVRMSGDTAVGVRVSTSAGQSVDIDADTVVISAGIRGEALVRPLLGGRGLGIRVIPHWTSYWDAPYPAGADLHWTRLPVWADLGSGLYGFPDDGESGFKVAWHEPRKEGDSFKEGPPTAEELEALRAAAEASFPALRGAHFRGHFACAYDATPDENFQIGPVPGAKGVYFVGGLSGHGYKHAPSIGESVAAALCGAPPLLDLSPYALRPS